jgi:translation elongation factor EF-G
MKAIRYVDPLGQSWEEDEIPAELKEQAEQYRHDMIETLADHDDRADPLLHRPHPQDG